MRVKVFFYRLTGSMDALFTLLSRLRFNVIFDGRIIRLDSRTFRDQGRFSRAFKGRRHARIITFNDAFYCGSNSMDRSVIRERILFLGFFKSSAGVQLDLRDTFRDSIEDEASRRLSRIPMLLYQITIALSVASGFKVGLADHIRAREDFSLLILRIAISHLQATSCLGANPHDLMMFNRCTDVYIKIITAGSGRDLSIRFFRGFRPLIRLFFYFRFNAT